VVGRSLVLVLVAGCGRLGFDFVESPPPPGDGSAEPETGFRLACGFAKITKISDGFPLDDAAADVAASAVAAGCATAPAIRRVSQDDPGILDPTTDRLLLPPDELVVIGGGDGPQRAMQYLLERETPITWSTTSSPDTLTVRERGTNRIIAMDTFDNDHDFALVFVAAEPIGDTRILSVQGMTAPGTTAAAAWFARMIAPNIQMLDDVWAVVEWRDSDGVNGVSDGDSFTVIESG
jgi:hypothetical protein